METEARKRSAFTRHRLNLQVVGGKVNVDLSSLNITSLSKVSAVDIIPKQKAGNDGIFALALDNGFTKNGGDIHVWDAKNNAAAVDGTIVLVTIIYDSRKE